MSAAGSQALNDPTIDVLVDGTTKGIPSRIAPVRVSQIGRQRWNVLAGDCPLPVAVLRADIMAANSAWMMAFARLHDFSLCPHGKTTMAPALFKRQLADGAWGITVATAQQLWVCLRAGVRRIVLANQPIGRSVDTCFEALAAHPDLELYTLADSPQGLALLAARAARQPDGSPALRVLVEIGSPGARTGCRDVAAAVALARAIAATPGLALAGVEAFEGVLPDATAVSALLERVIESARAIDALGLFGAEVVLTAGGSACFDLVVAAFRELALSRPVRRLLRSGCYLSHDDFSYAQAFDRIARERRVDLPAGALRPALQIWAYVQSRPDPDKLLLTLGKRDVGYDSSLPQPVAWYRPTAMPVPMPIPTGCSITALNDQHAHMRVPAQSPFTVGDMMALGIAHPCTTFERWQLLLMVDEQFNVVDAVRTFF